MLGCRYVRLSINGQLRARKCPGLIVGFLDGPYDQRAVQFSPILSLLDLFVIVHLHCGVHYNRQRRVVEDSLAFTRLAVSLGPPMRRRLRLLLNFS